MNRSIMAIGAHADDLEIHVGGMLAKYHALGYDIVYVMATNNMSGQVSTLTPDGQRMNTYESCELMMPRRKRECDVAAAALGTQPIHLDHPQRHCRDANLASVEVRFGSPLPAVVPADVPSILTAGEDEASIQKLSELIVEKNAQCIVTHGVSQVNIEHFATSLLVTRAFWKAVDAGYQGALLHWREAHMIHGEYNMRWETFIDYSPYLDRKMELIGMHACQMPNAHLPNFGHRLLAIRAGQACGCTAAETFTWVRRADTRNVSSQMAHPLLLELMQHSR